MTSGDEAARTKEICDYLVFKFVPDHDIARRKAQWYKRLLEDESIETFDPGDTGSARRLLAKITREELDKRGADSVSIGVSSGMDSRICLGALLDVLPPEKIFVFTYGHAGNRDYENAPHLLKSRVLNHVLINTVSARMEPTEKDPFRIKRKTERIVFSGVDDHDGKVQVVGRLGDALAGGHLTTKSAPDWTEARSDFIRRFSKRPLFEDGWLPESYDPIASLPDAPHLPGELMEFDLQLDLLYRQEQLICVKPALVDEINRHLLDASDTQIAKARNGLFCPFMDPRWQKSYLRMPRELRYKEKFYKKLCKTEFPHIFPEKTGDYVLISPQGSTNIDWIPFWNSSAEFRSNILAMIDEFNESGGQINPNDIKCNMNKGDRFTQDLLQRMHKVLSKIT